MRVLAAFAARSRSRSVSLVQLWRVWRRAGMQEEMDIHFGAPQVQEQENSQQEANSGARENRENLSRRASGSGESFQARKRTRSGLSGGRSGVPILAIPGIRDKSLAISGPRDAQLLCMAHDVEEIRRPGWDWRTQPRQRLGCGRQAEDLASVTFGCPLAESTVHAGMLQVASLVGVQRVRYVTPAAALALTRLLKPRELERGSNNQEYQRLIDSIHCSLVFVAVMPGNGHYTLVVCYRTSLREDWRIEYQDSLPGQSAAHHVAAGKLLDTLDFFKPGESMPVSQPGDQADNWSGGLQVLLNLESALMRLCGWRHDSRMSLRTACGWLNGRLGNIAGGFSTEFLRC